MISISKFTEIELQKLDIHTLRELARSIGVSSPTSKKKSALIENMLEIISGKSVPEYKNVNRGRPAKNSVNYAQRTYSFGLETHAASATSEYDASTNQSAIVSFENGVYYAKKLKFVSYPTDFKLDEKLVKKYALSDNDMIDYSKANGKVEILSINGKPAKKILHEQAELAFGVEEAQKNVLFVDDAAQSQAVVQGLAKNCHVVLLPISSKVQESASVTVLPEGDPSDEGIYNNFLMSVSVAQFFQKAEKKVVFVAENFASVLAACKQKEDLVTEQLLKKISSQLEMLTNLGGTFVGIVPKAIKKDVLPMIEEYEKK